MTDKPKGVCRECRREFDLTANGRVRSHGPVGDRCGGGSDYPLGVEPEQEAQVPADGPNPHRHPLSTTMPLQRVGEPKTTEETPVNDTDQAALDADDAYDVDLELAQEGLLPDGHPMAGEWPTPSRLSTDDATAFLTRLVPADADGADAMDFLTGTAGSVGAERDDSGPGRWFDSRYDGDCTECFVHFDRGDRIRATGDGGWQGYNCCGWKDDAPTAEEIAAAQQIVYGVGDIPSVDAYTEAEELLSRAAYFAQLAEGNKPRAVRHKVPIKGGRYRMPHPVTGKAWSGQRMTTFVKLTADSYNLTQWQLRNAVLGMAARPELALAAQGLDVKADRVRLNQLAEEAKEAAGGSDRATEGSTVHRWTEEVDAGLVTLEEVPEEYRATVKAYLDIVAEHGYGVVPHLVERTTALVDHGVIGTWDRVLVGPDGLGVVVDFKTGRLDYSQLEIATQLAGYAIGANTVGLADYTGQGDPRTWQNWHWAPVTDLNGNPLRVREDVAVVVHLPQGEDTIQLFEVPLADGVRNLEECARVRDLQKVRDFFRPISAAVPIPVEAPPQPEQPQDWSHDPFKPEPAISTGPSEILVQAPILPEPTWEQRWQGVTSSTEAFALWEEMSPHKAALGEAEFNRLVAIGQAKLAATN